MHRRFALYIGAFGLITACNRIGQPINHPQTTFAHPGSGAGIPAQPMVGQTTKPEVEPPEPAEPAETVSIELPRVHFAFDSAQILPGSRRNLQRTAAALKEQPEIHLQVEGHADERGTPAYNLALGEQRARAVVTELTNLGVNSGRLHIITKGEEEPLLSEGNSVALAANRRVEFATNEPQVELELTRGVVYDDQGNPLPSGDVPIAGVR